MTTFIQVLNILPFSSKLEVQLTSSGNNTMTVTMKVVDWHEFLKDNSWNDYKVIGLYAEDKADFVMELMEFHGCTKCGSKNCHGDLC